ncbi:MAG: MFS transporter, partial [Chloroflexota bacterium]|nr:MFS transporter [Chloroflexota bacterium]
GGSGGAGPGLAPPAPLAGYRAALIVGSAVGAASFLALALTRDVRPPRRQARELAGGDVAGGTSGPVWRTVLADATVQRLTATTALIGMGAGLFLPFLNVYFVEVLGASPAVYGWVSAGGTLTRLGATLLAPGLAARRGTVTAIAGSQIASVPFLILLGFAPHLTVAAVAVLVRGALMNMASPLLASFTMGALQQDLRGGANAVLLLVANVSRAGATLAGGALIAQVGYRWPYGLTALLYLASAALFWWWFGRDTSRAAPENATPEHGAPEHGAPD